MKRFVAIALVALTAAFAAGSADAQVRLKVPTAPTINRITPKIVIIPPSVAVKNVIRLVPGAKPLSVRPKGNMIIVKVKKGGNIIQFNVNAATGAISQLP
jgi:hypothetical protein